MTSGGTDPEQVTGFRCVTIAIIVEQRRCKINESRLFFLFRIFIKVHHSWKYAINCRWRNISKSSVIAVGDCATRWRSDAPVQLPTYRRRWLLACSGRSCLNRQWGWGIRLMYHQLKWCTRLERNRISVIKHRRISAC